MVATDLASSEPTGEVLNGVREGVHEEANIDANSQDDADEYCALCEEPIDELSSNPSTKYSLYKLKPLT